MAIYAENEVRIYNSKGYVYSWCITEEGPTTKENCSLPLVTQMCFSVVIAVHRASILFVLPYMLDGMSLL